MELKITILPETIKDPLSFMGRVASIAYNTPIDNAEKNKKRGIQCVKDNHGRLLEFCDVFFYTDGISIRSAREIFRHTSDGLSAVQRSTRYCSESDSDWYIPQNVVHDKNSLKEYNYAMQTAKDNYNMLLSEGRSKEDSANVLPLATNAPFVMRKNARCLADMSHVRLCNRALDETHKFMIGLIDALRDYSPEWDELADLIFMPKCQLTGWCDEHKSCGLCPKREDVVVVPREYVAKLESLIPHDNG